MPLSHPPTAEGPSPTAPGSPISAMNKRAVASGTLGSALEYFDFTVYGLLAATLFPKLFFSDLGASGGLLASFATFGVGFLARPLGAIVFGHLGDKYGRRPILYITLLLMGVSSIVIGLLPTGKGFAVAAILVGLRFIQGFSLGGEATGNQLMVMEHAPVDRRGFIGSIVSTGVPISQILANLLLVLLTTVLSEQQWESWGWRVPFLASIAIVAVAAYIRLKLTETPAFVAAKKVKPADEAHQSSGLRVLRAHPKEVTQLILSWGGLLASFYLVTVYGLSVMKSEGGMSSNTTFLILVIGAACALPMCVLGGWVSDRIGRKKTVLLAMGGCSIGMALFFTVMSTGSAWLVGIAAIVTLCSNQFASGSQPALFAEQFPTKYRFSGSALSITFSNVLFSAPAPFVASALADAYGTHAVLALVIAVLIVSALAVASIVERSDVDLVGFKDDASEPSAGEQDSATQDLSQAR